MVNDRLAAIAVVRPEATDSHRIGHISVIGVPHRDSGEVPLYQPSLCRGYPLLFLRYFINRKEVALISISQADELQAPLIHAA